MAGEHTYHQILSTRWDDGDDVAVGSWSTLGTLGVAMGIKRERSL